MANAFQFSIVALDRYSKVFRDLNDKASRAVRPVTGAWRSLGRLGRELHLDKAAKGIQRITEGAVEMGDRLGVSLAPLTALSEAGAAGGIAAGLGVVGAAIASLAARAGNLGYETARTARGMGISTDDLQRMRGAAELAGVSTEDMTSSLTNLGSALHEAEAGRRNDLVAMLNKLGISIKHTKDGAVDVNAAFIDMARAMGRVNDPYTQAVIASAFGVDRALPLLRQGADAVENLTKKAEELGLVRGQAAIEWSEKFGDSLNRLKGAAGGVANTLGDSVVPATTRVMDTLSDWMQGKGKSEDTDSILGLLATPASFAKDVVVAGFGGGSEPPPVHSISGKIGGPLPAATAASGVSPEVEAASRYVKGPLSLEQQQAVYNQVQGTLHIKIETPPGVKASATVSGGFQPTKISYSGVGGDGP